MKLPLGLCRDGFFYRYRTVKVSRNLAAIYEYHKHFNLHIREIDDIPRQPSRCVCVAESSHLHELKAKCAEWNAARERQTDNAILEVWNKYYCGR